MRSRASLMLLATCGAVAFAAVPSADFAGVWGTQKGQVRIQISGSSVSGSYQGRSDHSSDFRFTCPAAAAENATGKWQFIRSGGGQDSGTISLRLEGSGQLHIVMTYANGKPMLDSRLHKEVSDSIQGAWAAGKGTMRISRSNQTLTGTYQGRDSSSSDFTFTCNMMGETRAKGTWGFPDGSGRGPITLTLMGSKLHLLMTYANGKPMLETTVTRIP